MRERVGESKREVSEKSTVREESVSEVKKQELLLPAQRFALYTMLTHSHKLFSMVFYRSEEMLLHQ